MELWKSLCCNLNKRHQNCSKKWDFFCLFCCFYQVFIFHVRLQWSSRDSLFISILLHTKVMVQPSAHLEWDKNKEGRHQSPQWHHKELNSTNAVLPIHSWKMKLTKGINHGLFSLTRFYQQVTEACQKKWAKCFMLPFSFTHATFVRD